MFGDVRQYPQTIEEYVDKWITEKVVFVENNLITTVDVKFGVKKYYPVHPKGSSNRKWLEKSMKKDLEFLIEKYKQG